MAITTNGLQLTRLAGAAFDQQLSASDYSEILAANKTAAELDAWANAAVAAQFRNKTTTDIAKAVLANVGLSTVAGLENWVAGQLNAGGGVAKAGASLLAMLNDYSNMSTTDATYGASVVTFNQKTANSQALSQTAGTATGTYAAVSTATPSTPFTLTTGVDLKTTGAGADTFTSVNPAVATATLTAGDNINGGAGTDTLNITSAAEMTIGSGVTMTDVENVSVSASGGALTLDTALMTGITSVTNSGSSQAVTVSNLKALVPVTVMGASANTTVGFAAAVTAGAADAITLNLNAANNTGTTANVVSLAGFETVNVVSSGSASGASGNSGVTIESAALTTLNVTGTVAAKLLANLAGASASVTGTVTSDDGAHDVNITGRLVSDKLSVSMGAGNDQVRVGTVAATHTISGGDGTDTLRYSGADAVLLAATANITGIETVTLSNATPASFAMTGAGVTTVNYTTAAAGTFGGLSTGGTIGLNLGGSMTAAAAGAAATATAAATLTAATYSGATDSLTVNVGLATHTAALNTVNPGAGSSTVSAVGVESVTFNSLAGAGVTEPRTFTFTDTTATTQALKSITVNSSIPALTTVVVTPGSTVSALTTVNLSGVTGGASFSSAGSLAGATITGGVGNDSLTGGAGNDTIDAGAGTNTITGGEGVDNMTAGAGIDRFEFASNAVTASTPIRISTSSAPDTINSFTTTVDKISITGTNAPTKYIGTFATIQAALSAQASSAQAFGASFITGESTLYVFQNTDGTMNVNDMTIKLPGVTAFAEGDLLLGAQAAGSAVTLSAPLAVTGQTGATSGTTVGGVASLAANMTTGNDTVNSTLINLRGSTVTAGVGADTLALSITSTATTGNANEATLSAADLAAVTGFETITLANFVNPTGITNSYNITLADANVGVNSTMTVTSSHAGLEFNGTLTGTGTTFNAGALTGNRMVSITGGSAHDVLVGGAGNDTINGAAGNDIITGGTGINSLNGGDGNDTIILNGAIAATAANTLSGGTAAQGVADILQIGTGGVALTVDLTGSTISNIEDLNLAANVAANLVTMTGPQYAGFTGTVSGNGTDDVITLTTLPGAAISAGTSVNAFSVLEGTTITVGATPTTFVLTETGTAGTVTTAILGAATYSGTWVGWDAADIIRLPATGTVTPPSPTATVYDFNSGSATLVLSKAQHDGSTFTNLTTGTQTVNIAAGTIATLTALAGIDAYSIGDDTATSAVTVSGITGAQSVSAVTAGDTITFAISGTYTGTLTGENADLISLAAGADISGATGAGPAVGAAFTGVTGLTMVSGATNTMTALQFAGLTATPTAGGVETITLTTGGTVTGRAAIEVYNLGATAANAFTFAATPTAATQTVNTTGTFATSADLITGTLADGAGGKTLIVNLNTDGLTDRIKIINTTSDLLGTNTFQINGFAIANDALQIIVGTTTANSNGAYQAVAAGVGTNVTVGVGGVIEITGSNAADLTADGDAGGIEVIIANAIGTITTGTEYTAIVYSGANAGIYQLTTTQGTNLLVDGVGFTVELVAIVTGVGMDGLATQNFF
jgi:hypothetical protein